MFEMSLKANPFFMETVLTKCCFVKFEFMCDSQYCILGKCASKRWGKNKMRLTGRIFEFLYCLQFKCGNKPLWADIGLFVILVLNSHQFAK